MYYNSLNYVQKNKWRNVYNDLQRLNGVRRYGLRCSSLIQTIGPDYIRLVTEVAIKVENWLNPKSSQNIDYNEM